MTKIQPMNALSWLLLITLSVFWGGSFFFNKVALVELPPLTVLFFRVSVAAVLLNVLLYPLGYRLPKELAVWGALAVLSLMTNIVPFSLILWAQTELSSGAASVLNGTTPFWTVLIAHSFTRDEKIRPLKAVGAVLGFLGVATMVGVDAMDGFGKGGFAVVAMLAATFSYGCAKVFGKRFRRLPSPVVTGGLLICSAVISLPAAWFVDGFYAMPPPHWKTVAAVLGLAVFSTCLAYLVYFYILAKNGATSLSLVTFLIPISASMLGYAFFNETYSAREWAGIALIASGLLLIDGKMRTVFRKTSHPFP